MTGITDATGIADKQFFRFGKRDVALKSAFTKFSKQHRKAPCGRLVKMAMAEGLKAMGCYGKREAGI